MNTDDYEQQAIRKIISAGINTAHEGILILKIKPDCVWIAICNDSRTEEDVLQAARTFKVRLMMLTYSIHNIMADVKVLYKTVTANEMCSLVNEIETSQFEE